MNRNLTCIIAIIVILFLFFTSACFQAKRGGLKSAGYIELPFKGQAGPDSFPSSDIHLTLKKGDRFFFENRISGAGGLRVRYDIEDDTVVKFVEKKRSYDFPILRMLTPGMNYGSEFYIFQALKAGETKLTTKDYGMRNYEVHFVIVVVE